MACQKHPNVLTQVDAVLLDTFMFTRSGDRSKSSYCELSNQRPFCHEAKRP